MLGAQVRYSGCKEGLFQGGNLGFFNRGVAIVEKIIPPTVYH